MVPPWVGEHPDIFDDPNFSITAIDLTKSKENPADTSLMELSLGGGASASAIDQGGVSIVLCSLSDLLCVGLEVIPEDPLLAETYYSQVAHSHNK